MASLYRASTLFGRLPILQKQHIWHPSADNKSHYVTMNPSSDEVDHIKRVLKDRFPLARSIDVSDLSDGCGDMYEVVVESVEFKGLTTVKQHRLVNEALKDEIKTMHGIRIQTVIPAHSRK